MGNRVPGVSGDGDVWDCDGGWFVVQFMCLRNIPCITSSFGVKSTEASPQIVAFLSIDGVNEGGGEVIHRAGGRCLTKISSRVTTPRRTHPPSECAVFQSYRNFGIFPPARGYLSVEVYHGGQSSSSQLLGYVDIPIDSELCEEGVIKSFELSSSHEEKTFSGGGKSEGGFAVSLQRLFLNSSPPRHKVFFIVRHGESYWNKAQSGLDIGGMLLDRDHPLTDSGIRQGQHTNERWRQFRDAGCDYSEQDLQRDGENGSGGGGDEWGPLFEGSLGGAHVEQKRRRSTMGRARLAMAATNSQARQVAQSVFAAVSNIQQRMRRPSAAAAGAGAAVDGTGTGTGTPSSSEKHGGTSERVEFPDYGALPVAVVEEPCKTDLMTDQAESATLSPPGPETSSEEVKYKLQNDSDNESGSGSDNDSDSVSDSDDDSSEDDNSPDGMMAAVRPSLSHLRSLPDEDEEEDGEDTEDGLSERTKFSSLGGASSVAEEPAISVEMEKEKEKEKEKEESEQVQAPRRSSMRRPSAQWLRKMRQSAPALMVLDQRQQYLRSFLQADVVYCSPLTRALQTALVLLEGHPALELGGLTLASSIREVKALGGMDSVGVEVGLGIWERLHEQLSARVGPEHCDELMAPLSHGGFHIGDCDSQWWSPAASFEGNAEVDERVMDFLSLVRYCPHHTPIFVGHSLFFKALCSTRVSRMLDKNRPLLAERLGSQRLANATVLALTVVFTDDATGGGSVSAGAAGPKTDEAVILDADVLFGGSFAAHGHHHHHLHDHHDHRDAHHEAEEGQNLPPPPTPPSPSTPATGPRASIVSSIKGLGQGLGQGMAGAMQSMPSFLRGKPKDK